MYRCARVVYTTCISTYMYMVNHLKHIWSRRFNAILTKQLKSNGRPSNQKQKRCQLQEGFFNNLHDLSKPPFQKKVITDQKVSLVLIFLSAFRIDMCLRQPSFFSLEVDCQYLSSFFVTNC